MQDQSRLLGSDQGFAAMDELIARAVGRAGSVTKAQLAAQEVEDKAKREQRPGAHQRSQQATGGGGGNRGGGPAERQIRSRASPSVVEPAAPSAWHQGVGRDSAASRLSRPPPVVAAPLPLLREQRWPGPSGLSPDSYQRDTSNQGPPASSRTPVMKVRSFL